MTDMKTMLFDSCRKAKNNFEAYRNTFGKNAKQTVKYKKEYDKCMKEIKRQGLMKDFQEYLR